MTDRDLTVIMLLLVVSIVVGVLDTLIDLNPVAQDGVLTTALVFAVGWLFYRLRA